MRPSKWESFAFVLLIALLVFVVLACTPPVRSGKVVEKHFTPAHEETYTTQQYNGQTCTGSGSSRICTPQYSTVWHTRWVPDRFELKLRHCESSLEGAAGPEECREGWIDVTHGEYREAQVGDFKNYGES